MKQEQRHFTIREKIKWQNKILRISQEYESQNHYTIFKTIKIFFNEIIKKSWIAFIQKNNIQPLQYYKIRSSVRRKVSE